MYFPAGSMRTSLKTAVSSASRELLAPGRTNAATRKEFLFQHVTTQVSGCGMFEGISDSRTGASTKTLGFYTMEDPSKHKASSAGLKPGLLRDLCLSSLERRRLREDLINAD
ncbi:hypothetical protein llap_5934 [Limosa lapponica baueri]|uniref:Uncharacterized protein n=1 Tax=Limosa lapponica baueri TaxID=1758121 RepID=A0A2I0UCL5_LIMLA|nr:hypothetical protein llap_5934 [Limosa lapponica baueri]